MAYSPMDYFRAQFENPMIAYQLQQPIDDAPTQSIMQQPQSIDDVLTQYQAMGAAPQTSPRRRPQPTSPVETTVFEPTSGSQMEAESRSSTDTIMEKLLQMKAANHQNDRNMQWMSFFSKLASSKDPSLLGGLGEASGALTETTGKQQESNKLLDQAAIQDQLKYEQWKQEQEMKREENASQAKLRDAQARSLLSGGSGSNTPITAYNPLTGQMEFTTKGNVAGGGSGLMPAPPTGKKYRSDGVLIPAEPSTRDQMRIQKSVDSAGAASSVERLTEEANEILGRYETSKAAPIVGTFGQLANAVGLAGPETKARIKDFERIDKISKEMGALALQQFGGNDTDKELQIAIKTNIDPSGLVETNMETSKRRLLAARILQERPAFEEEWVNKVGSLTAPDPQTGETFSRVWMRVQKDAWENGLKNMGGKAEPDATTDDGWATTASGTKYKVKK